jgi:hypothetical protein
MQSVPEKVSYWIQRADFTSTDLGPVSLAEALVILHEHDWKAELGYETALETDAKENCPPGIGFVTKNQHQLHICPRRDGTADCYYMDLNSSMPDSWFRDHVSKAEQDRLLEMLIRADYTSLTQQFESSLAVWCSIQRADFTYAQEPGSIRLAKAQSLLRGYDWKAELAYQHEVEAAGKDWCRPTIGFTGAAGLLHVQPDNLGTVECYLWDNGRQRCWGCGGLGSDEQSRILDLFYRNDPSLTRDWYEFEMETYADERGRQLTRAKPADSEGWLRTLWLAKIRQIRARRGQPPEVTEEERNLSERGAGDLFVREAQLEEEEQRREETTKAVRSSRKWCLIIAAGGTILAAFLYSGVLDAWRSEQWTRDLWAWSVMMTAGGLVVGGLNHLQLRALRLGTPWARRLSHAANGLVGAVMGVASLITVALLFVFAGTLMLGPGGAYTEKHFFIAVGGVIGLMLTVAGLAGYLAYRSCQEGSGHEVALEVATMAFLPFVFAWMGVFGVGLIVLLSAVGLQASWLPAEIVRLGVWLDGNLNLALKVATAMTASAVAITSWFRWRKSSALVSHGLATALLVLALLAVVQVMGMWGAPSERPYLGPTIIT